MSRISKDERLEMNRKTHKPLVWLGIMSIVMLFAGLTSGHIVAKNDSMWVKITLPQEFLISTYIIVASSLTFFGAVWSMKKNKLGLSKIFIALTLVLGIFFIKSQLDGYEKLNTKGNYFTAGKIDMVVKAELNWNTKTDFFMLQWIKDASIRSIINSISRNQTGRQATW
jgi:cytochrome c oxidase subunit III